MTSFAIIGAGKVGSALARLLAERGYQFIGAASRSMESARAACSFAGTGQATTDPTELTPEADLVFITTPDEVIGTVCAHLGHARALKERSVVAHCSGALPSSVLADARACGAHPGSLHPLQTFASAEQAVGLLPGSWCCIEGDEAAAEALRRVAASLNMHTLTVRTELKPLYHAAAVVASNYLVALQNAALKLAAAAEIERGDAFHALLPLVRGTVDNIQTLGIPAALTGPIARGDTQTVRRHLEAISAHAPDLLELYRVLGRQAVEVARDLGSITCEQAADILELLD